LKAGVTWLPVPDQVPIVVPAGGGGAGTVFVIVGPGTSRTVVRCTTTVRTVVCCPAAAPMPMPAPRIAMAATPVRTRCRLGAWCSGLVTTGIVSLLMVLLLVVVGFAVVFRGGSLGSHPLFGSLVCRSCGVAVGPRLRGCRIA